MQCVQAIVTHGRQMLHSLKHDTLFVVAAEGQEPSRHPELLNDALWAVFDNATRAQMSVQAGKPLGPHISTLTKSAAYWEFAVEQLEHLMLPEGADGREAYKDHTITDEVRAYGPDLCANFKGYLLERPYMVFYSGALFGTIVQYWDRVGPVFEEVRVHSNMRLQNV